MGFFCKFYFLEKSQMQGYAGLTVHIEISMGNLSIFSKGRKVNSMRHVTASKNNNNFVVMSLLLICICH